MVNRSKDSLVIAVDAMGGDQAPSIVVEGVAQAVAQDPRIHALLYGDSSQLIPLVKKHPHLSPNVEVKHTDEVITASAKPSAALRNGKQSSMNQAIQAVVQGQAEGVVSAGNTGAYMALSLFSLRQITGIRRPAICTPFPTQNGYSALLDVGANVECTPQDLVEFAIMGELFAQVVLGKSNPTVGLLNIGSEDTKGNNSIREAAALLRGNGPGSGEEAGSSGESPRGGRETPSLIQNFYGFIEGDDIGAGTVDVVVTDGFTGNVALKTAEGTAKMIVQFLRESFKSSLMAKMGYLLARPALEGLFKQRLDPRKYNGALFLGLNGVAVKSHGGTDATGFANALEVTAKIIREKLNDKIREALSARSAVAEPLL
jgi:glycerol-3-phosphate acyltransferase PlsX